MKYLFPYLLFFILFFTIFNAYGQADNPYARNIGFGIKGGISLSNLSAGSSGGNPVNSGYSSFLAPDAALFTEIKISGLLSVAPTLEYSSQGGMKNGMQAFPTPAQAVRYFPDGTAPKYIYANFKNKISLNYLMLPILIKLNWNFEYLPLRVYIDGGPFASYLVNAKQASTGSGQIYEDQAGKQPFPIPPQSFDHTMDLKGQLQTLNYGVEGNIGMAVKLDRIDATFIFIEIGGNYGLRNIQKDPSNGKNNTGAAVASIGYSYWF
ncbi:MAG: hypothetical protein JWP44_3256 [Mucilaginibacter sp.]|nr:hypothetical protein [Mucilaginibacter sp.]